MSIPNSYPGASYPVKPAAHGKFHRLPFFDIVPYLYKVIAWAVVGLALSALSAYGRDVPHCRVPSPPLYEEVTPLQSRLDELDLAACIPLEVGAEREAWNEGSVHYHFRLSRPDLKTYMAEVNFEFVKPTGKSDAALNEDFHRRVESCLEWTNEHLLGPDGKRLYVKLSPIGDLKAPPAKKIKVEKINVRNMDDDFSADPNCSTIAHEVMHALGLVDLYREKDLHAKEGSEYTLYDCRAIGEDDYLMSNSGGSFRRVFGADLYFDQKSRLYEFPDISLDPATPVGGSLLSELEFQAILTAGCHRLNPLYSDCTATAYDTSREHHGEGCRRPLPEACSPGHPGWIHGASKK